MQSPAGAAARTQRVTPGEERERQDPERQLRARPCLTYELEDLPAAAGGFISGWDAMSRAMI
jgi:hypothetical protein